MNTLLRSMMCSPCCRYLSPAKVMFVIYRPRPRMFTTADAFLGRPRRCRYRPESQTSESGRAMSRKSWRRLITHCPGSGAGYRCRPAGASVQFPCIGHCVSSTPQEKGEITSLCVHARQAPPTSQQWPASLAGITLSLHAQSRLDLQ